MSEQEPGSVTLPSVRPLTPAVVAGLRGYARALYELADQIRTVTAAQDDSEHGWELLGLAANFSTRAASIEAELDDALPERTA
jgi:hypothetical protein